MRIILFKEPYMYSEDKKYLKDVLEALEEADSSLTASLVPLKEAGIILTDYKKFLSQYKSDILIVEQRGDRLHYFMSLLSDDTEVGIVGDICIRETNILPIAEEDVKTSDLYHDAFVLTGLDKIEDEPF